MGLGGPEVKFGQIAQYFGDQKLHVLGWFWHRFGKILACLSPDYDQISKITKIMTPGPQGPFVKVLMESGSGAILLYQQPL